MNPVVFSRLARRAPHSCLRAVATTPTYTGTVYKDAEHARENQYFSKEDESALRKLLLKVKKQADAAAPPLPDKERGALDAIVGKYKLAPADIDALIKWRHAHDH